MKRIVALGLVLAGLFVVPTAALATGPGVFSGHDHGGPSVLAVPQRPIPPHQRGYFSQHGYSGHDYSGHGYAGHGYSGHGYSGHGYAVRHRHHRMWIEPRWAWNGWRWVWVPGYFAR